MTRAGVGGEKFDAMEAPWSPDSPGAALVSVGEQVLGKIAKITHLSLPLYFPLQ